VGDAHFSRGVGLADTRTSKGFGASVSTPELMTLGPWWNKISSKLGMNAVNAQGLGWGTFGPQTGVKTRVGAPKLEILADEIAKTAKHLGIPLEEARNKVLLGEIFIPNLNLL
jgi:hypothetical protein